MSFDVVEIGVGLEFFLVPVKFPRISKPTVSPSENSEIYQSEQIQCWVTVANSTEIALEMSDIDGIESNLESPTSVPMLGSAQAENLPM